MNTQIKNKNAKKLIANFFNKSEEINCKWINTKIKVGGILPNDYTNQYFRLCGSCGLTERYKNLYGFYIENGNIKYEEIRSVQAVDIRSNYAHTEPIYFEDNYPLTSEQRSKYLFFAEHDYCYSAWQGMDEEYWNNVTLFRN